MVVSPPYIPRGNFNLYYRENLSTLNNRETYKAPAEERILSAGKVPCHPSS